jgi:hypothetical protein
MNIDRKLQIANMLKLQNVEVMSDKLTYLHLSVRPKFSTKQTKQQ